MTKNFCSSGARVSACAIACVLAAFQAACSTSYPQGVLVDQVHYDKTVFSKAPSINIVSDLRQGNFDGAAPDEILAVGSDGIHLLTSVGQEKRFTPFRSPEAPFDVKAVEGAKDGKRRFLGVLLNAAKIVLFDESGAVAWSVAGVPSAGATAADLDGDGRPEVVALRGTALVVLSLEDGTLIRQLPTAGSPLFFDVTDSDGNGRPTIVAENYKNEMSIVSADGAALAQWKSPHAFYRFGLAREGAGDLPSIMILSDDAEELLFLDTTGKVVRTLKAPFANHLATPSGHAITVANGQGFMCLATSKGSNHHHIVYVYGADHQLVYADSADDDTGALLVSQNTNPSSFFVGARNIIWRYTEKP